MLVFSHADGLRHVTSPGHPECAGLAARLWEVSGGRVVSTLEGGYDLDALAASVAAYVGGMAARSA